MLQTSILGIGYKLHGMMVVLVFQKYTKMHGVQR